MAIYLSLLKNRYLNGNVIYLHLLSIAHENICPELD